MGGVGQGDQLVHHPASKHPACWINEKPGNHQPRLPGLRTLLGQSGSQTRKEISIRDIQRGSHYREVVFTGEIEVLIPEFGLQLVVQAIVLHLQQQIPRLTFAWVAPPRDSVSRSDSRSPGSIRNPHTLADHSKQGSKLIFGRISGLNFIRDPT